MKMSNENKSLYELLDSSCEDMLLYFQEVVYHLGRDSENLAEKLDALFAEVRLTAADEYREGEALSAEVEEKLAQWKKRATATPEYVQFSQKYGSEAAKAFLGMSGKFSGNPTGIGADNYPNIVKQVYEGNSALQRDLKIKYPKVSTVVEYISSTCGSVQGKRNFSDASYEVVDSRSGFHLGQSILLNKFSSFLTERDLRESGHSSYYDVMEYQFSMVFTQFLVFAPDAVKETQNLVLDHAESNGSAVIEASVKKESTREKDRVVIEFEDTGCGFKNLVHKKRAELEKIQDPKGRREVMSALDSLLTHLINENRKVLAAMDASGSGQNFKMRNEKALELAILDGKKSFKKLVGSEYKTVKVADIIGCNPRNMTLLERLETADKIENLKNDHVGKLVHESITAMQKIMEKNRSSDHFAAASKGIAILQGEDTYQRSPDKSDAEYSASTIPKEDDGTNCLEKRLDQFRCHFEENKGLLSDKPVIRLISFIENIKAFLSNFGKKLNQSKPKEVKELSNTGQAQTLPLRKRGLSKIKLSDSLSIGMFKVEPIIQEEKRKELGEIPTVA